MIWAVLTKRQSMARLMWQHGEQAMAKALVASRLYQAMAMEAADDDLDVEIYDELDNYSKIFEDLSLQLLEFCYQSDDDLTQHLLTGNVEKLNFLREIGSLFCYKDKRVAYQNPLQAQFFQSCIAIILHF